MTDAEDFLWNTERFGNLQNVLVVPFRTPKSAPDDLAAARQQLFRMFWGFDESQIGRWRRPASAPGSVAHWFETVSRGKLRLSDAGGRYVATGDYFVPNTVSGIGLPSGSDLLLERMRGVLLQQLDKEIDYRPYARGGDVDTNDLIVVMVERGVQREGGAVRRTDRQRLRLDGIDVELRIASVSIGTSRSTTAHEILHALLDRQPSTDLYGPGNWNTPGSLMGGTSSTRISHPDPQHKLLLGWDYPAIVDVARRPKGTTTEHSLIAAGATDAPAPDRNTVVALHDSTRGTGEYFLLEYRTSTGGTDAGYTYDRSVGSGGLAIWHVESTGKRVATRASHFRTSNAARVELAGDDVLTGRMWLTYQGGGWLGDGRLALVTQTGTVRTYRYDDWRTGADWADGRRAVTLQAERPLLGRVMAAGDGVLYEVTEDGELRWHRILFGANGRPRWAPNSGREVGLGRAWNDFRRVLPAGDGVIYAVTQDGALVWYRHTGWETGEPTWVDRGEREVGTGRSWDDFRRVLPAGDGVIYAVTQDGALVWYRHTGWETGEPTWVDRGEREVGTGREWDGFPHLIAAPDGVFFAIDNSGSLVWYRHTGAADGTPTWVSGRASYPDGKRTSTSAGVVHFGPDGVLDTDPGGDRVRRPASIHLVAAPDYSHGFRHGFWTDLHGNIWLRWYDGTSASARISVGPGAGRSDRLGIEITTGVVGTRRTG